MNSKDLPASALIRLDTLLRILPISRSSWYQGIREGRYPHPIKLGPRTSAWRLKDIQGLVDQLAETADHL